MVMPARNTPAFGFAAIPFVISTLLGCALAPVSHEKEPELVRELNPLEKALAARVEMLAFEPQGPDEIVAWDREAVAHPKYLGLKPQTRWFLGEYSHESNTKISVPARQNRITGTDLGSSVPLNGLDFFYLGDTFWPDRVECGRDTFDMETMSSAGCAPNACCNDAIVVSRDTDPRDGLDLDIPLVKDRDASLSFKPLVISGIHDDPRFLEEFWSNNRDPNYTAPGGTGLVNGLVKHPGPRVLMWYSTSVWPQGKIRRVERPYRAPRSYVVVSEDGFEFESLIKDEAGKPVPFSVDAEGAPTKFLCTSPVEITAQQLARICSQNDPEKEEDEPGLLCSLPESFRSKGGILVFGSGRNYRFSPLYLAYLSHAHLAREDGFHTRYATRDQEGLWSWTQSETDAYPVIGARYVDEPRFRRDCMKKDGFWRCAGAVRDLSWQGRVDEPTGLFGELSVQLVTDGPAGMEPTLVMLSNHQYSAADLPRRHPLQNEIDLRRYIRDGGVYARTAKLSQPHNWSAEPIHTGSSGYGPYIIERHTRYDEQAGELELWHVLSLWRGPNLSDSRDPSQYGMATTQAHIPWPAGGAS
jgi:hypothetical protein